MTPLTRLVRGGTVAAFKAERPSFRNTKDLRAWPGRRRLPSVEGRRNILAGSNNELSEWSDPLQSNLPSEGSPEDLPADLALADTSVVEPNSVGPMKTRS